MVKKAANKPKPKKEAPKANKPAPKNTKETHNEIAKLGSKAMKNPKSLTPEEIKSLGASVVSQSNPRDNK